MSAVRVGPRKHYVFDIEGLVSHYGCTLYLSCTIDEYLIEKEFGLVFPLAGFCPGL